MSSRALLLLAAVLFAACGGSSSSPSAGSPGGSPSGGGSGAGTFKGTTPISESGGCSAAASPHTFDTGEGGSIGDGDVQGPDPYLRIGRVQRRRVAPHLRHGRGHGRGDARREHWERARQRPALPSRG